MKNMEKTVVMDYKKRELIFVSFQVNFTSNHGTHLAGSGSFSNSDWFKGPVPQVHANDILEWVTYLENRILVHQNVPAQW